MQLWTEYEGVTIDGVFSLRKLLMPEGRSAFFSTAGIKGEPTVVRLIECHFDEEEILARWRSVEALNHPNFLKFERFGQTELDGRPVVYAVFEKVDGNLAEVLDQGHLEVKDVAQLASSLVAALEVLHTHGFIHEHIAPRNIFAVGSEVKLRGDSIREAPEGREGREAKKRDVRDLATVLLQALTQRESLAGVSDAAIPPPFGQIIRGGLDGSVGLEKIGSLLDEYFGAKQVAPQTVVKPVVAPPAVAEQKTVRAAAKSPVRTEAQMPLPLRNKKPGDEPRAKFAGATAGNDNWRRKRLQEKGAGVSKRSWQIGAGVAAVLLLLFTWVLARAWSSHQRNATQATAVSQTAQAGPAGTSVKYVSALPAAGVAARQQTRAGQLATTGSHPGWRVIAFTYNRRTDAEKRVSDLAHTHPELQPAVFTPSGHAPYLVSVGGVMDREGAQALAHRSRSLGLPRDMYAQNYNR